MALVDYESECWSCDEEEFKEEKEEIDDDDEEFKALVYQALNELQEEYENKKKELSELSKRINSLKKINKIVKPKKETKPKKPKFDLYAKSVEDELKEILKHHYSPVKGWVQGSITQTKYNTDTPYGIYMTLEDAYEAFLKYIKPKIKNKEDNEYGGIVKTTRGYMLKPNFHPKGFQTYLPNHRPQLIEWVMWKVDLTKILK